MRWKRLVLLALCIAGSGACASDDGGDENTGGGAGGTTGGSGGSGGSAGSSGTGATGGTSGAGGGSETGGTGGGGGAGGDDFVVPDAGTGPLEYAPCADAERVGGFQVRLTADFSGVEGAVANGVDPTQVPEEIASEGACTLYRSPALFCDPMCSVEEKCDGEGCVPAPRNQDVGTVTVEGLQTSPLEMRPRAPGFRYTNPGTLPNPAFMPGDDVVLWTSGGEHPPFALRGRGSSSIAPSGDTPTVESGMPLEITWVAPETQDDAVQVQVKLDIARHGGTPARIQCKVPDTGSFIIPESLITQLVALGFSGFPAIDLVRRSVDSTMVEGLGCVELTLESSARIAVMIPGVISCNDMQPCPDDRECLPDQRCAD